MKVLKGIIIIIYIILGASFGIMLIPEILNDLGMNNHPIYTNHYVDGFIGMIVFFLIFGLFINKVTRLLKEAEMWIMQRSAVEILFATLGLVVGLFISVMASFILEMIGNSILNHLVPIIITLLLCYLGFQFGLKKRDEMLMFLPENIARSMSKNNISAIPKLLDTSAIIDGRLDILNQLYDLDYPTRVIHPQKSHSDIDKLLVELAQVYHAHVITTDFNLNKVCHVQGITALNVNDLSEAIKPNVHQGDRLNILLTKMGKEPGQGVGYLDDGTMVVVDHAKSLIGKQVELEVISLLQTSSGRIIFAKTIEESLS